MVHLQTGRSEKMAIKSNALAENKAAILAEDGGTIYATLQMRHGKESEMDKSKFVPAEIGVVTDTKRAVVAFAPGDTKDVAFKEDIPEQDKNYNNLENKPSIGGTELSGNKTLEELGIQPKGNYLTAIPEEYVTDTELTEKLESYPTKEEQTAELGKKLDKDQGKENAGKVLVVGEDGTAKPGETPIKVDATLSQTGQAADAEKVGARLHEIDSTKFQGPVKTISGEILKIENAAEQPPAGLRVYGKAKQNTTTGAQLLNAPDKTNKIYGVTMDVSGGVASFSGTLSSNNATFWFIGSYNGTDVVMTLPAGKYYLQNCSMQTLGNSALKTGAITSETEIQITGVAYTYTDSSPKTIYPMINAGSKALPWEPYTGEKPSPSPEYPQEIEIPGSDGKIEASMNGKNLATGRLYYVNYSDGHAFIFNKEDVKLPYTPKAESNGIGYIIPCKKGCTYTLSGTNLNENASLGIAEYKNEEEANDYKNSINCIMAGNSAEKQKTITAIGDGVLVCMLASVWTDGKSRIHTCTESELLQVEIGEEATEYEPPRKSQSLVLSTKNGLSGLPVDGSGNYTDSNGQQWICDSVKFYSDGTGKKIQRLKRASGLVFKRVNYGIQEESYLYEAYLSDLAENDYPPCLCTGLKYDKKILDNNLNGMYAYPKSIRARFKDSKNEQEDIEKLKTFEFLYVLQTPIETDLSSEEIAAYRALKLNNPVTNVFTAESLMPGIEVDYVPETEQYIEKSINENTQKAPAIVEKASGEMLNVTDSSDLGLKGLKVFGKGEQAKTTGAQLFQPKKENLTTNDGLTGVINSDGSVTVTGTPTKRYAQAYFENVSSFPEGKYFISGGSHEVSTLTFQVDITRQDDTIEYLRNTAMEFKADDKSRRVMIKYDSPDLQKTNYTIYPMLNVGETQAPYEPYTGNQPSPNPDYPQEIKIPGSDGEIEVSLIGVNLFDASKLPTKSQGGATVTNNGDGSFTISGKGTLSSEFRQAYDLNHEESVRLLKKGFLNLRANKTEPYVSIVIYSNESKKELNTTIKEETRLKILENEIKDEAFHVQIQFYGRIGKEIISGIVKPMLYQDGDGTWEPYKHQPLTLSTPNGLPGIPVDSGGNYADESGQQWMCDEIDPERGKYIQRVIKKGNPVFAKNGDYAVEGSELYFCSIPEISETKETSLSGAGISTHMQYTSTVLNRNETGFYIGYGGIWARIKDVGDLDAFNKKLQDAVFYFTYKGIPETETDLLEKQLEAYRTLHTNYPTTKVSTDSTPQAGLEMEYVADTKSYIDKKFKELQKALVNTNTQVLNKVMEDIKHV